MHVVLYSFQNFKRWQNTQLEICTLQNNGKRIEVSANFTFENEKYRYDTKVYDNAECILNYENLANDVKCKLVYVRIRSKNFNIGCKAEIFL